MKQSLLDGALSVAVSIMGIVAALFVGYLGSGIFTTDAERELGDWLFSLGFIAAALFVGFYSARDLVRTFFPKAPVSHSIGAVVPPPLTDEERAMYPGAWQGDDIPLETQIENLAEAGLTMSPDRTIEEVVREFPRDYFERTPYDTLLFVYGSGFCERGHDFDMECLTSNGDYTLALAPLVSITGHTDLVTDLSDSIDQQENVWRIHYLIKGEKRQLAARIDRDWVDPKVLQAFLTDIENALSDGKRFRHADNGQAMTFFYLTDEEADAINQLRPGALL